MMINDVNLNLSCLQPLHTSYKHKRHCLRTRRFAWELLGQVRAQETGEELILVVGSVQVGIIRRGQSCPKWSLSATLSGDSWWVGRRGRCWNLLNEHGLHFTEVHLVEAHNCKSVSSVNPKQCSSRVRRHNNKGNRSVWQAIRLTVTSGDRPCTRCCFPI